MFSTDSASPRRILLLLVLAATAASSAFGSISVYVAPESVARRAPLALEGTVAEVKSGYDPETGSLATYVTLDVVTVHRGPAGLRQVVVREPGGDFGTLHHRVDAVPTYTVGERVFVFLEPAADGALRTAGAFFGKFRVSEDRRATRDLDGRGTIVGRPSSRPESIEMADLVALAVTAESAAIPDPLILPGVRLPRVPRTVGSSSPAWRAVPPETDRLLWDGPRIGELAEFTTLSTDTPGRWYGTDSGTPIVIDIERARNPLGDGAAAVYEMERAMEAWTNVPESRIVLQAGNTNASFTATNSSPRSVYPPGNVILFGDPYGDIDDRADPTKCEGTLAVGGYWFSGSSGPAVNGVTFRYALRLYVIFANDFECFLDDPDSLAEVATHELGHGIGLGHSTVREAIMWYQATGGRGASLDDDDRDAVHCIYPHTFSIDFPDGGETLDANSVRQVLWSSTSESGPDPGEITVEVSADGGDTWAVVRQDEPNDGACDWSVPGVPGTEYRLRVIRPNRLGAFSPFPASCSADASNADFSVVSNAPLAGSISGGAGLRVARGAGEDVVLSWDASCSAEAGDYAIYEGSLTALRSGIWNHAPVTCSAGTDRTETIPGTYSRAYYLVVPLAGSVEGSLGPGADGQPRPEPDTACGTREAVSTCP